MPFRSSLMTKVLPQSLVELWQNSHVSLRSKLCLPCSNKDCPVWTDTRCHVGSLIVPFDASHPTTGPMLPASDILHVMKCFLIPSRCTAMENEWFKECVSNRSPGTRFPSIICYSSSLFPPCLFSYKHPARGLKALSYLKYVNTCQLWTLSIWECFSSLGEKTLQREHLVLF